MNRLLSLALAAGIMSSHAVGSACIYPPPSPRQAGETDAQHSARSHSELNAYLSENARKTEVSYFKEARSVYLARIIRSEEINVDGSHFARQIALRPLQAIKGDLPHGQIKIKDRELTSCGFAGDGPATWGEVSQIVIVFDGVHNEGMTYRSRLYAVVAKSAQQPQLLAAWNRWKAQANGAFDQ